MYLDITHIESVFSLISFIIKNVILIIFIYIDECAVIDFVILFSN